MLKKKLKEAIEKSLRVLYDNFVLPDFSVEVPDVAEHGDYACNAAMIFAKTLKKNPMEIAHALAAEIEKNAPEVIKHINVAQPGFVNIFVNDSVIFAIVDDALKRPDAWGKGQEGKGKTVVLDYFQLNIAKQPHVGHLRSAVIGDALKRVLYARGYHTVADTHVGDWGTQFGILLYAYKEAVAGDDARIEEIKKDPFVKLQELYTSANTQEGIHDKGKQEFAKLEQGDRKNRKIWKWMVEISMKKLEESAHRLNLLAFEEHRGESAYEDKMAPIVELALEKGVARKTTDNAIVVNLTDEGLDEAVLVKSDGATTYLLRDLATIQYRKKKHRFWKNLYIVDNRQSHHFRQLFRVAALLGFEDIEASEHVEFGFMKLPEGAMSTRAGNVIFLDVVLDEAEQRAREVIKEKNPNLANADEVAKKIALGAIKFFDLSHNRISDIVFRWEDALAFEGNTGPYIQYTHARLKSILRKSTESVGERFSDGAKLDREERGLLFTCVRLPEQIERVIDTWSPHLLASYIYNLAKQANEFYHSHPILSEPDQQKRESFLMIVQVIITTLAAGLYLLGIDAPEEM